MKTYLTTYTVLAALLLGLQVNAQRIGDLNGINYQAVAIDEDGKEIVGLDIEGKPLYEKEIGIRFTIQKGQDGEIQYQETHTTLTDQYGLFSLVIGHGEQTGSGSYSDLLSMPWIDADQWLKVEIAIENDGNYRVVSLQQFMTVPYSFYTDDIADDAITTAKIFNEEILAEDINTGAVTTDEILDATIANEDIANATVDLTTKVTNILPVANGGTGSDASTVTDGQILIGDSTEGKFVPANITAGEGINIVESAGGITIESPLISADVGSDGTFTIPVGSNGDISSSTSWESPASLQIPPISGKPYEMGDLFLASANVDLKGCLLSVYLQDITGEGDAKLKVVIYNPKNTSVTLETPVTFKFLLVK